LSTGAHLSLALSKVDVILIGALLKHFFADTTHLRYLKRLNKMDVKD
jgi:hypothetical protein